MLDLILYERKNKRTMHSVYLFHTQSRYELHGHSTNFKASIISNGFLSRRLHRAQIFFSVNISTIKAGLHYQSFWDHSWSFASVNSTF